MRYPPKPDHTFIIFIQDQLQGIRDLQVKRMFGGHGLYSGSRFFGIVHKGQLFFKTSEQTREKYLAQGSGPFRPNEKQTLKNYYQVPVAILEDEDTVTAWAQEAIALCDPAG